MKINENLEKIEEFHIKKLQYEFKMGYIYENEISDDDKEKLIDLYKKQNLKIKEKLKKEKNEISKLLKDLKS